MEATLNKEQIEAWRKVIFIQLEERMKGAGIYALVMPESEVIKYWQKIKAILEHTASRQSIHDTNSLKSSKPICNHSNSFTGNNGKYCIDCEKYV